MSELLIRVNETKHRIDHAHMSSQTNEVGTTVGSERRHHPLDNSEPSGDTLCSNEDPKLADVVGGEGEKGIKAGARPQPGGAENGQVTCRLERKGKRARSFLIGCDHE